MYGDLKSTAFRAQREKSWRDLEYLLKKLEQGGLGNLSAGETLRLPRLYRAALSSLSVARAISLDVNLIQYLESLTTRAYIFIYGPHKTLFLALKSFFLKDWPHSVRALHSSLWMAFFILMAGWAIGFVLTVQNSDWFYTLVSADLAGGRTPSASKDILEETIFDGAGDDVSALGIFATSLFTHNSQVAMLTFALGFALAVPTILLLFTFGASVGAMTAVFAGHDLGLDFTGWLLIHGTTELFAIVLASAAGISLGRAIAFPGPLSRRESLARAGQTAGTAMLGAVIMLLIAGLLEGYARQLIEETTTRYGIGGMMLGLWLGYFHFAGRKRAM